jgi:AP-1 complex subunit sigma 1/2
MGNCLQSYVIFTSHCLISIKFSNLQAYYVLDEILIAGELQESSKKNVARLIAAQVMLTAG